MKIITISIFILIIGFLGMGIMHEYTHIEIFSHYGIDSHIQFFSHFPDLVVIADEPCEYQTCILAHNNSDSFFYPLTAIYTAAGLLLIAIIGLLESLVELKKMEIRKLYSN